MTNVYDLSEKVKELWNEWEFRALILLSFSLQIFLVFFGRKRKHVAAAWLRNFIWLAYLSAEWVATLCMSILARIQGGTETNCANPNPDFVPAFWAATLLVHLGGPDAITAYSVEDNQLWLRQLLQLVTQVAVALYALLRSWWSKNPLIFVAVPVFVSGVIKYGERIWALRSASFDNAVLHEEVQGLSQQLDKKFPSAALLDMSIEDINRALGFHNIASQFVHLHEAHLLFQISKMLFTDYMLPFSTHMTSYLILSSKNAADAFRLIEVELGFMFDALYTKVITGLCWQGFLLRAISCSSSIAALLAFARMTINCHAYSTTNIVVSYCLLVGAVLHEIYSFVFLVFSDWVMLWLSKQHNQWATAVCQAIVSSNQKWPFNWYDRKKWRGTMAQQDRIGDENTLVKMLLKQLLRIKDFRSWEKVDLQLKDAIFNYLLQKRLRFSHYIPLPDPGMNNLNEILAERSDQVLRTEGCLEKESRTITVDADFRESLLLWYIAIDICYYDDSRTNGAYVDPNARISKSLS
ncbi:hypothetical protein NC653_026820 [Populus alba x Populus x berolinensis]|uniref:DUF4220 domain-containing protein n=3 Tax=Populus TaxID=3689 RepID=A0A4V6XW20_POPAL|nr:uncharacterized protein LOC118042537 [Populus alba]KAJ6978517.1 hypothetical protein NC653_026820 [Populus alba x Populus x berolinensis]TKR74965.1 uncharacterized protein D5086_0000290060 [Populus alba]